MMGEFMCEFGDSMHQLALDTGASINFDYDDEGLYAFIASYGNPGCNGNWERISSSDDWRAKAHLWREWYNRIKSTTEA